MSASRELRTIQALRAIACLMVVAYHAIQAHAGERAIIAWPNLSSGVDLFFVISGVVMVTSSRTLPPGWPGARIFWARRIRRVVPLYWGLTALKLALAGALPTLAPHTRPCPWNVAASFLFIPSRDGLGVIRPVLPVGWTLQFEMLFYAAFGAALLLRARPLAALAPILGALAILGVFRTAAWPAPLILANSLVLEFAAGMAIASLPNRVWPAPVLLALAAPVALLSLPSCGPWRGLVWGLPAALLVQAAIAREAALAPRIPRWLREAGDASYATYLVHPFVIAFLARHGLPGAILSVPASAIAGRALHLWLDQPLQRLLRRAAPPAGYRQAAVN